MAEASYYDNAVIPSQVITHPPMRVWLLSESLSDNCVGVLP